LHWKNPNNHLLLLDISSIKLIQGKRWLLRKIFKLKI
jgi:hypothetical protein